MFQKNPHLVFRTYLSTEKHFSAHSFLWVSLNRVHFFLRNSGKEKMHQIMQIEAFGKLHASNDHFILELGPWSTFRGLPGIVGIEYDPHYCQYGWTAVSVSLDLFSNRQLTVMCFFERGPLSKPCWRQKTSMLYTLRSCGRPADITTFETS